MKNKLSVLSMLLSFALVPILLPTSAKAIVIDVSCGGVSVGNISINTNGSGLSGGFTAAVPLNLAGAAAACGQDHFNWYQVVTGDNHPPPGLTVPFVDPPAGGLPQDPADNLIGYWDETPLSGPDYDPNLQLSAQIDPTGTTLHYSDFPVQSPGTVLTFKTWLLSEDEDDNPDGFMPGFTWQWSAVDDIVTTLGMLPVGTIPTDAEFSEIVSNFDPFSAPEPATWTMLLVGFAGLGYVGYYRRNTKAGSAGV